ncbi:SDR family NAD(P)-dependent oxidoreductase [Poseidonocella sp. HB161398]|uniref:SDR family NAD(P)-dependent oxidoreductase n=1 Tax=Poseidonocella sp. HB161398 TaxID=2320855 RepID=UPI003515F30F
MMTQTDALPALVTGASRGLGFAIARALAAKGHHVMAVARTIGGLEELDDAIKAEGGAATLAPMDITEDGAMQHLCRSIHDRWGGLSLWVHAAIHAAPLTPANMIAAKDWDKSLAINVDATRRLIVYVAPLLGETGQALFFDDPGVQGKKFHGSYGATKAGQIALAQSWAAETVRTGPKVQILTPPPMPTATRARFFPTERPDGLATIHEGAAAILAEAGL